MKLPKNLGIGLNSREVGMSKFDSFLDYPSRGLAAAESVLLTVWPTLSRHHDDIVLIGGLAVHYLTREHTGGWPGAVTMDVDMGISLAADDDRYGNILDDMRGLGFAKDSKIANRLVREVDDLKLYLDFMTDSGKALTGTTRVSDVVTSSVPGLNRALHERRMIIVEGQDFYGVKQCLTIPICDVGPLLVLKLNAFGGPTGRRHPKDAYDVLLCVTGYPDGPVKAIQAFQKEAKCGNLGYQLAVDSLKKNFSSADADGPVRAAEFLRGTNAESQRIKEELVTMAKFLLEKA